MTKKMIKIDNGKIEGEFYSKKDMDKVIKLYREWISISKISKDLGGRKINTPEALSEVLGSYCYDLGRTNNAKSIGKVDGKSMDAVSKTGKRIQIKGSAVKGGTLTSFSPKTNYDEILMMDFYANGDWDGTVKLTRLKPFSKNIHVNTKHTFGEFQKQGKRPRFNLIKRIRDGKIPFIETKVINIYKLP